MRDKPRFGRDAREFLRELEDSRQTESIRDEGVRILTLAPAGGERITVRVRVSNRAGQEDVEFLLMREHVEELALEVGPIGEDTLPELEYYGEVARAYGSACSSFAYGPSSIRALRKKLALKGYPKDVCDDAMACVRARGFVNEEEIACRRAQLFVEKHWGRSRICRKLREEGFDEGSFAAVGAFLDEVDFSEHCATLIRKRFGEVPEDRHERDRMCASLTSMGYSASDIRRAMALCK